MWQGEILGLSFFFKYLQVPYRAIQCIYRLPIGLGIIWSYTRILSERKASMGHRRVKKLLFKNINDFSVWLSGVNIEHLGALRQSFECARLDHLKWASAAILEAEPGLCRS